MRVMRKPAWSWNRRTQTGHMTSDRGYRLDTTEEIISAEAWGRRTLDRRGVEARGNCPLKRQGKMSPR